MTEGVNTRALALEVLLEVTEKGGYSHLVLGAALEKYQYLEKKERAFVTRLVEGTIQRMIELDYIIDRFSKVKTEKLKPVIRAILRMGVYQLKYMDFVPASAACNESVKLAKKKGFSSLSGYVNGVLRAVARQPEAVILPDEKENPSYALSVRYSMPEWIVTQWINDYGEETTRATLRAFLADAPLTIRTNLLKTTPEELCEKLAAEGVTAEPLADAEYAPLSYAFAIRGYDHLTALESFREGLFYVQDVSSMLAVEAAEPADGDYCIDVCAAPGGKSMHLAEKMHGTGTVDARDLTAYKTALISENVARHGLSNVTVRQQDASVFDAASENKADIVLADLPCSGLGILRKKADIKYRMSKAQQEELVRLQRGILDVAARYVKPGGVLLYSTCTIDRAENEDNVSWFLKNHAQFKLEKQRQIFPGETLGDGFFYARLCKAL